MEIKGLNIQNKAVLAPMAGFCDIVMRKAADDFDVGFTISEMVSARALYFGDKKSHELMATYEHKSPYGVQLFGFEPNDFVSATKHVLDHKPDFIDINMGCPAPKIVNNGSGSALMKTPEIAAEIAKTVVENANGACVEVVQFVHPGVIIGINDSVHQMEEIEQCIAFREKEGNVVMYSMKGDMVEA